MNGLKCIERGNGNISSRKGNEQEAAATLERVHPTTGSTLPQAPSLPPQAPPVLAPPHTFSTGSAPLVLQGSP